MSNIDISPIVSIIVPVYNVEKYLHRCMTSLLNQTLKNIEIIMVDDGSLDNSSVLCDEYAKMDDRVKVIHKENEGLGNARNSGSQIAKGKYIAYVDSDDFVDLNMYQRLYETAEKYNLHTVYAQCYLYKNEKNIVPKKSVESLSLFQGQDQVNMFLLDMIGPLPDYHSDVKYMCSVCMAIYSREIIEKYSIKFYSEKEIASEDLLYHINYLSKVESIGFLPEYFYYYCDNENSITKTYTEDKIKRFKKLLVEVEKKLNSVFPEEQYKIHFYRFKFFYFRHILNIRLKIPNRKSSFRTIKLTCSDPLFKDLFEYYPYKSLPFKHRLFFIFSKYRFVGCLAILFYLLNKKNK